MALKFTDIENRVYLYRRGRLTTVLGAVILLTLSACGGSSGGGMVSLAPATPGGPVPVRLADCLDGTQAIAVGADDPLYPNAWHLENTGSTQVVSAFRNDGIAGIDANVKTVHQGGKGCTGKGVTIAVVDNGMELAHEDLAANVLAGRSFNFGDNSDNPSPAPNGLERNHGTAVAGIAAAQGWNGKGARGVAPNASLAAFKVLDIKPKASGTLDVTTNMRYLALGAPGLADPTIEATALFGSRADKVDVFNFSLGTDYAAPPTVPGNLAVQAALASGTSNLRGGLGAVYIKSSGNGFDSSRGALLPNGATGAINCVVSLPIFVG